MHEFEPDKGLKRDVLDLVKGKTVIFVRFYEFVQAFAEGFEDHAGVFGVAFFVGETFVEEDDVFRGAALFFYVF